MFCNITLGKYSILWRKDNRTSFSNWRSSHFYSRFEDEHFWSRDCRLGNNSVASGFRFGTHNAINFETSSELFAINTFFDPQTFFLHNRSARFRKNGNIWLYRLGKNIFRYLCVYKLIVLVTHSSIISKKHWRLVELSRWNHRTSGSVEFYCRCLRHWNIFLGVSKLSNRTHVVIHICYKKQASKRQDKLIAYTYENESWN